MRRAKEPQTRISRRLAFLLRHSTQFIDGHGWAEVPAIVQELRRTWRGFDEAQLRDIVATDEKGRYAFDSTGTRIRANQGHSVPVDVELRPAAPPAVLYHGTATRFLDSILAEGLKSQNRLYVHLSTTEATAVQVGARHGGPVVLRIDAGGMAADGTAFFLSENGVWLTRQVPPRYIEPLYTDQEGEPWQK